MTEEDKNCICRGNWRKIVSEIEPFFGRHYEESRTGDKYQLFGLVHGDDDYYYGMIKLGDNQKLKLLSCVGSIESFGCDLLPKQKIFVFGSNLAGRHGAGSAKEALTHHGAQYGIGVGIQGNSYGIPTKNAQLTTLPLREIEEHVFEFVQFARHHVNMEFDVVKIGCGLAGYDEEDIAPMFKNAPNNVILPDGWRESHVVQ